MIKNKNKKKNKSWLIYFSAWMPVIGWMLMLFLLSNSPRLPGPEDVNLRFIFMKGAHMLAYAVLYFWIWRGWRVIINERIWLFWGRRKWSETEKLTYAAHNQTSKQSILWLVILGVCVLYGMSDEFHQSFIVGRTATWRDVGFDTLGACLGMAGLYWWF